MLFDDILKEVGEFGVYQVVVYVVLGLVGVLSGWNTMAITFTGAKTDHWCKVPALSNLTYDMQRAISAPPDEQGLQTYSQCFKYDLDYSAFTYDDFLNWNRTTRINASTPTVRCESWVFDQSVFVSTVRTKWNLVCEKDYLVQIIQTCFMSGYLFGSFIFGQLSDRIGRMKTLTAAIIFQFLFCLACPFVPYLWMYCVSRFMVAAGLAGTFGIYTVLVMEVIGPRYRVVMGVMAHEFTTLGMLTLTGFSWAIRDSSKLEFIVAILSLFFLLILFIPQESPRWLVSVGRIEDATKVLRKIAAINGKELPADLNLEENIPKIDPSARKPTVIDLLKNSYIRSVTVNMWFSWFATCCVYYGLSLGVKYLKGSLFVNNTISALVQIPAHIITAIALENLGRRWPLVIAYLLMGACSIACMPLVSNTEYNWLFTTFLMLGKASGSGVFSLIYVYSAELFPTNLRNVGVGSSSTVARIGGLLQPQIALSEKLWRPLPFLVYGSISLLVAIASVFLPETKGRNLPESIEDMKRLREKKKQTGLSEEVKTASFPEDGNSNVNKAFVMDSIQKPAEKVERTDAQTCYL